MEVSHFEPNQAVQDGPTSLTDEGSGVGVPAESVGGIEVILTGFHKGQAEVARSPARFKVLCAGRRWGKTVLGVLLCLYCALKAGRAWWVGLTFPQARIAWRLLKRYAAKIPGAEVREGELMCQLSTGGFVQIKTAENPEGLRSEGLDFVVLDECAHYRDLLEVWAASLRPALSDRIGSALFITTPNGYNEFNQLFLKAKTQEGWASWQFPSWTNPHLKAEEIETARKELPTALFNQEFGAEFIDLAGACGVIKPEWIVTAKLIERIGIGERRVIGADIAAEGDDETVAYCLRNTNIVKRESWRHLTEMESAGRLHILCQEYGEGGKYKVPIIIDAIGIGAGVASRLADMGDRVTRFKSNEVSESGLYRNKRDEAWWRLRHLFEAGEVTLTYDDPELVRELLATEFEIKGGKIVVAPKDKTKEKLGRSPDRADAYVMAIWGLGSAATLEDQRKATSPGRFARREMQASNSPWGM